MRLVLLFLLLIFFGFTCMVLGAAVEKDALNKRAREASDFIGKRINDMNNLTPVEATMLSGAMAIMVCYFAGAQNAEHWFDVVKRNERFREESENHG